MNKEELEVAIYRVLEGREDRQDLADVAAAMREDRGAMETYLDCVELHLILSTRGNSASRNDFIPDLVEQTLHARQRRAFRISMLASAAAFLLLGILLHRFLVEDPVPPLTFLTSAGTQFSAQHPSCDGDAPAPGSMAVGSSLIVESGVVELTFASGVRSIVQGPAELTLVEDSLLNLGAGRVWCEVPPEAAGFRVATKQLLATDLGTEFAVVSEEDAGDEVHVMAGRVLVAGLGHPEDERTLSAGEGLRVGAGGRLVGIPIQRDTFLTVLPAGAPSIISNGKLNTEVSQYDSTRGDSGYYLDPTTGNVLEDQRISAAGGIANADTGVDAGQWLWSTLTRGFAYEGSGGDTGEGGAFVSSMRGDPFNQKPRAVAQFVRDGRASKGLAAAHIDVAMEDNSGNAKLTLLVELYGWDSGEAGPRLSLGGATGLGQGYNHTILNDAKMLLSAEVPAPESRGWTTIDLGDVDLGGGYHFFAWRVGVMGASEGDHFAFDNLRVGP